MRKVSLKIIQIDGNAGYITADSGKEIFIHTENTKIQTVKVEPGTTIYYKNYNIFSKKVKDTDDKESFIKIISINDKLLVEFEKQSSYSEKSFINNKEPVLRNKFKLHVGETLSIIPNIKDHSTIYTIVVDDIIEEN